VFRIADSGPGVPRELRSKVIEPFFTTKGAGTGLGLAIARGVIQGHAGRLVIDDRPGGGALVTVEIPLQPPGVTVSDYSEA
jgi:signal transduction histidine kinase